MASFKSEGFTFYGKTYPTKNACMREQGIPSYAELDRLIAREKQGYPFPENYHAKVRAGKKRYGAKTERVRKLRRYFANKLAEHGFWQKAGEE
jgi:hypothetical protein